jgi:hypothetical protein
MLTNLGDEGCGAGGRSTTERSAVRNGICKLLKTGGQRSRQKLPYIDRLSGDLDPEKRGIICTMPGGKYPELDSGSRAAPPSVLEPYSQRLKINAAQRRLKALVAEMRAARASGDESRLVTLMQENDRLARELDALKDLRYG